MALTTKERELLKTKIEAFDTISADQLVADPFLQHVRENHPKELEKFMMPPDFLGPKDAVWQLQNPRAMAKNDRASVVLSTKPPKYLQPYTGEQ